MIVGHDGAGALDEFGPDSYWAYFNDNPEDDEWVEELIGRFDEDEGPASW